ncbi:T9SS type A sorting domain-containing protein [uncultured Psychroserpens sp.]|uniref:T9SS type A sorting domain-containing protein n=1 Tax=uncultured Psychroserpens sp. TaxID=255436 RepID=UPI00260E07E4|nr:T9SS type A sorting domain-containing protein [uncultured Psychroserpens sp.]
MKKIYLTTLLLISTFLVQAQLQKGDIAFTGYIADNPDQFSFVALVDIPANTTIRFTDNGWFAAGGFRNNEGTLDWTSPNSIVTFGTEILITDVNSLTVNIGSLTAVSSLVSLSFNGDQLFAYDPANTPVAGDESGFYAGIQMNGAWDANATGGTSSAQPASLVGFSLEIAPEVDNAVYDCSTTTGSISQLKAAILNPGNWTTNDNPGLTLPTCNFMQTLSTNDVSTTNFDVYPNPASHVVNINATNTNDSIEVSVFDVSGKEVIRETLENNQLNVSNLNTGLYILKITQNNASTTKKLAIK